MAKKKKPEKDNNKDEEWTPGPANPESGGGSTGKSRSRAEDDFRKKYDEQQGQDDG